jgi:hypothetical protein
VSAEQRSLRDPGTIIRDAIAVYRAHFVTLFGLALLAAPLNMLAVVLQRRIDDPDNAQLAGAAVQLAAALVSLAATAAIIAAVATAVAGRTPEFGESLDTALGRYWTFFKTVLLEGVLIVLAMFSWPFVALWWLVRRDATVDGRRDWWLVAIPLVLPAYLAVRWTLAPQAVMVAGKANWSALDDSAAAVRGRWWRTLGIVLLISVLVAVPVVLASVTRLAPALVEAVTTALAGALTQPFAVAGLTLLYFDMRRPAAEIAQPETESSTEEEGTTDDIDPD